MSLDLRLSLQDYAALAGLVAIGVGGGFAISEARMNAAKAELLGQMSLIEERSSSDRAKLREDVSRATDEIKAVVSQGLQTRSNEVGLAISRMTTGSRGYEVVIANMPVDGVTYDNFQRVAAMPGFDSKVVHFSNRALGSLRLVESDDFKAGMVGSIVEGVPDSELAIIEFRIELDSLNLTGSELTESLVRSEIERLERVLQTLNR